LALDVSIDGGKTWKEANLERADDGQVSILLNPILVDDDEPK
jgi:hypothetical protein